MSTNGCLRLLGIDPNAKDDEVSEEEIRMMVDVGSENADNIIGVLKAKEYFRLEDKSRESVMRYAVRDPYFVPATIKADRLFRNMKKGRRTMAVVLDEYGGMMGVITVKDLIEQLVGDYYAYDDTEDGENIKCIGENTWKLHGSALLEDVSRIVGVTLYCEEFDTFNGLIFHTLGKVPADWEKFTMEIKNLTIKVVKVQNHMVEVAIVRKKEAVATKE